MLGLVMRAIEAWGDSLTWIRTLSRRLRQCVALAARELTDYFSSLDHGNPVVMLSSLCLHSEKEASKHHSTTVDHLDTRSPTVGRKHEEVDKTEKPHEMTIGNMVDATQLKKLVLHSRHIVTTEVVAPRDVGFQETQKGGDSKAWKRM